ncbi:MAG: hypothetical protein SPI08_05615 [Campylobacter sp.]|nr:hypothetical protein [Campylobacter sp.]
MISEALDSVAPIISAIAAFFSAIAAYQSAKAAKGSTEIQIRQLIRDARLNFIKYKNEELVNNSLIEELSNAYDEACSKYNSSKICKKSFERMYKNEIKNHVEDFKPKEEKYLDLYKVYNKFISKKTNKIF